MVETKVAPEIVAELSQILKRCKDRGEEAEKEFRALCALAWKQFKEARDHVLDQKFSPAVSNAEYKRGYAVQSASFFCTAERKETENKYQRGEISLAERQLRNAAADTACYEKTQEAWVAYEKELEEIERVVCEECDPLYMDYSKQVHKLCRVYHRERRTERIKDWFRALLKRR